MPSLTLTVSVKDEFGNEVLGAPIIRRFNVTQLLPFDDFQAVPDNSGVPYHNVPNLAAIASDLQCFILTPDQQINLKFNNGGALGLSPNAVLVLFGTDIQTAPFAQFNNPALTGTVAANLEGLTAGV